MSSFTTPLKVETIPLKNHDGRVWWLPPSLVREEWYTAESFTYAVGSLANPSETITVPRGFRFDGASVPLVFVWLVPRAHPVYMQSAALHDWLYVNWRDPRSRADADRIFREALEVQGVAGLWRWLIWLAVRIGGAIPWYRRRWFTKDGPEEHIGPSAKRAP